jgi:hypothetical protein
MGRFFLEEEVIIITATVAAYVAYGASPTTANTESNLKWQRSDTPTATTNPIPIPTATGNKYSYLRYLFLDVTGTASTNISNRRISIASSLATGLQLLWLNQATYTQNNGSQGTSAGNYPADDTAANGTVPGTPAWAAVTTTPTQWDNTSVSTGSTGRNGNYVQVCLQISHAFDPTSYSDLTNITMSNLVATYDEA